MFRALVEAAERFENEQAGRADVERTLLPPAYKDKGINWVITINDAGSVVDVGTEYKRKDKRANAPIRYRSGTISESNLKSYLLIDDARYALGIAEAGKAQQAELAHRSYIELLERALQVTEEEDFDHVLRVLKNPSALAEIRSKGIKAKDIVAFKYDAAPDFATDREQVQQFWNDHLRQQLSSSMRGACCICGEVDTLIQTLPVPIVILGEKCQVTSFEQPSFRSFGRSQTTNAPMCYDCAVRVTQALDYLLNSRKHRVVLARDDPNKTTPNPMRNHVAVFWLKHALNIEDQDRSIDTEEVLAALMREDRDEEDTAPRPELSHLEALLKLPWTGSESATTMAENGFHIAVLSANKGRLAVRDWIEGSLEHLHQHLTNFLNAQRIIDFEGQEKRVFTIPMLIEALETSTPGFARQPKERPLPRTPVNPNFIRDLLRTAYQGIKPPQELLVAALQRFRNPKTHDHPAALHAVAAVLKLVLTYGTEATTRMEQLDRERNQPAYLCGRLFAVLEHAQYRASDNKLNRTLVDSFYSSASTAPKPILTLLHKQAQMSHLAKLRRDERKYGYILRELPQIMSQLDQLGGFPSTLSLTDQADFALGYYAQHARLQYKPNDNNQQPTEQEVIQ